MTGGVMYCITYGAAVKLC